jgi:uncharacterized protein (TIGR00730 family)
VHIERVCVFASSSVGNVDAYAVAARRLAAALVGRGIGVVYGGGQVGLMGVLADAALELGGEVVGVIPRGLFGREIAHAGVTDLVEVESMHERKALMYDLSDGFVALPGGLGTLEELSEVLTWNQLGLHTKPAAVLDVGGFWRPLLDLLDAMVGDGLLKPQNRALLQRHDDVDGLLDAFESYQPPAPAEQWITPDER